MSVPKIVSPVFLVWGLTIRRRGDVEDPGMYKSDSLKPKGSTGDVVPTVIITSDDKGKGMHVSGAYQPGSPRSRGGSDSMMRTQSHASKSSLVTLKSIASSSSLAGAIFASDSLIPVPSLGNGDADNNRSQRLRLPAPIPDKNHYDTIEDVTSAEEVQDTKSRKLTVARRLTPECVYEVSEDKTASLGDGHRSSYNHYEDPEIVRSGPILYSDLDHSASQEDLVHGNVPNDGLPPNYRNASIDTIHTLYSSPSGDSIADRATAFGTYERVE